MSDYLTRRLAEMEKKRKKTPDILMALEHPPKIQKQPSEDTTLHKQLLESKTNYRKLHNIYTRTQKVLEGYTSAPENLTAKLNQLDLVLDDGRGAIIKMKQQLKELSEQLKE